MRVQVGRVIVVREKRFFGFVCLQDLFWVVGLVERVNCQIIYKFQLRGGFWEWRNYSLVLRCSDQSQMFRVIVGRSKGYRVGGFCFRIRIQMICDSQYQLLSIFLGQVLYMYYFILVYIILIQYVLFRFSMYYFILVCIILFQYIFSQVSFISLEREDIVVFSVQFRKLRFRELNKSFEVRF